MLADIKGQVKAVTVLDELGKHAENGRTLLFTGIDGVGKTTTAVEFARGLFAAEPFLSPDLFIYRNDDYLLKTKWFLGGMETMPELSVRRYFYYLNSRVSQAIWFGEISSKDAQNRFQDARAELEGVLLSRELSRDKLRGMKPILEEMSSAVSGKTQMSINVVRAAIEFNSKRPSGRYRVTVLGNFENATEEAQNSALKLFEEPPDSSFVIVTTCDPDKILPTIRSRALQVEFAELSPGTVGEIAAATAQDCRNMRDFMSERVFNYSEVKRGWIEKFFNEIAPAVTKGIGLFEFIDEITASDIADSVGMFLESLMNVVEKAMLARQSGLRNAELTGENALAERLSKTSDTAEMKILWEETRKILYGVRKGNWNPKSVLPALLLEYSRWENKSKKA